MTRHDNNTDMNILLPPFVPGKRETRSKWLPVHDEVLTTICDYVCGTEFDASASPFDRVAFKEGMKQLAYFTSDNALKDCKDIYSGAEVDASNHLRAKSLLATTPSSKDSPCHSKDAENTWVTT